MKKIVLSLMVPLVLFETKIQAAEKNSNKPLIEKSYSFIHNDHSQISLAWKGKTENSLGIVMQSLAYYFKKASERDESFQSQILLTAKAAENWLTSLAKKVTPGMKLITEVAIVPKSYEDNFNLSLEPSLEEVKNQLRRKYPTNNSSKNYTDSELTSMAMEQMSIGFNPESNNFNNFFLSNPWPSTQIQAIAGDVFIDSVHGRLTMALVLSLPSKTESFQQNLGGYAQLEEFSIPSSSDGKQPVYAILNIDLLMDKTLKLSESGDLQFPLKYANLKVNFSPRLQVVPAKRSNPKDYRLIAFKPISNAMFEENKPSQRLPYFKVKNLIPKGTVWEPLQKRLGSDSVFDSGFVSLNGAEIDLLNLEIIHLFGNLEVSKKKNVSDGARNTGCANGTCLNWTIEKGDITEQLLLDIVNKNLAKEKDAIRAKIAEKMSELKAIASGSYKSLQVREQSGDDYSAFSNNMTNDLCHDGTLDPSDDRCQALDLENK
ncbi:MAG: hypothetical protein ACXVCP_09180 [Bdellovibrio sp.]